MNVPEVSHMREYDNVKPSLKGFLILSRLPFLTPGLASLLTGIGIALAWGYQAELGLIIMSIAGVALIMLATYYFNEFYDLKGDLANRGFTKFSGGSRAIPDGLVPHSVARFAGLTACIALVAIAVIYILFYFTSYPLLLPMALLGAFCGVFYSHPPFQWSYRGVGEVLIGVCYGTLTVVSGFYLTSGVISSEMLIVSLPAAFSIFAVIVVNELPDLEADRSVNKKTLVVRLGLRRGWLLFALTLGLTYPLMLASMTVGIDPLIAVTGLPVLLLSVLAIALTCRGRYAETSAIQKAAGLTIVANALSSLLFIPAVMIW